MDTLFSKHPSFDCITMWNYEEKIDRTDLVTLFKRYGIWNKI